MTESKNTQAVVAHTTAINLFDKDQFEQLQRMARMFANSDLVPDIYKATSKENEAKAISNTIIAINIAQRIGADILMVMQNMTPIYGKPSWSSKFLIGTVNSCGRFEPLQFKFDNLGVIENYKYTEYESEWKVGQGGRKFKDTKLVDKVFEGPVDNIQCIAFTTKRGSQAVLEGPPVTIKMAIDEGWYTKKGSKWPNMPQLMCTYRSASFWTSAYAPDLSLGMQTIEEARDIVDVDYVDLSDAKKQAEQTINKKANKQSLDFDDDIKPPVTEPEDNQPADTGSGSEPEGPMPLNVKTLDEARQFLVDNHGLKLSNLLGEKVIEVATELGYKINLP